MNTSCYKVDLSSVSL